MTNQKIYKKIKKSGAGGAIVLSFFFTFIMLALIFFSANIVKEYIISSKLSEEYEILSYMADIYETGKSENSGDIKELLDKGEHIYFVRDKSGKVLTSNGEITCNEKGEKASKTAPYSDVMLYKDIKVGYLYTEEGEVQFDLIGFWKWFNSEDSLKQTNLDVLAEETEIDVDAYNEDPEEYEKIIKEKALTYDTKRKYVNLPIWMGIDVNDGAEEFVGMALVSVNMNEFGLVIALLIGFVGVFTVLNMSFIIRAIASVVRKNKIVNYFFADTVTKGHNWMWFHIKGNELIRSWRGRKNNYAIVNLVFVNYRNYIVSHSLAEGEKMLAKVYNQIKKMIDKKDMCAHTSSSTFALAIKYQTEEEIKEKLQNIISTLENIDADHKFNFQAGVNLINAVDGKKESVKARKKIEIENEYNNACTARARISDTNESGIVYFDDKLVEEQIWLDKVQEKQAQAVANEEFLIYYQPKYDPRTDKLLGAEALIRWDSPDFGFVTPFRFIPIFEKNGFITEIDHYMITHVARDQKKWLDKGYTCVPVSVNVSRAHFIESDLAEQIRDMVDSEQCPHEYIEIELTESAFFDDKKAMINTINKLKSYGFTVSMDDFGAGYSSLNSLKDMPLDVLKLDADFFRGENENGRGEIVVSEAIKLAKSLNMKTVAEGVETEEQVKFLAGEGCDMIQGYYYAKPMPEAEYEERMR